MFIYVCIYIIYDLCFSSLFKITVFYFIFGAGIRTQDSHERQVVHGCAAHQLLQISLN